MKCTDGGEQPNEHTPTQRTRALVESFVTAGFMQEQMATYLRISLPTLTKHYRKELDETLMDRTIALSDSLYMDALNGDKQAREFWLKYRAKWAPGKAPEEKEKDEKIMSVLEKLVDKL